MWYNLQPKLPSAKTIMIFDHLRCLQIKINIYIYIFLNNMMVCLLLDSAAITAPHMSEHTCTLKTTKDDHKLVCLQVHHVESITLNELQFTMYS